MTWPIRLGFQDSMVLSSVVVQFGCSAKWIVRGIEREEARLKTDVKIEMSPTAGSPQRSMPTMPWVLARERTERAVGRELRRSMERLGRMLASDFFKDSGTL